MVRYLGYLESEEYKDLARPSLLQKLRLYTVGQGWFAVFFAVNIYFFCSVAE